MVKLISFIFTLALAIAIFNDSIWKEGFKDYPTAAILIRAWFLIGIIAGMILARESTKDGH